MSIEHTPECNHDGHDTSSVVDWCTCGLEQRLRDEIERLRAAIVEHRTITTSMRARGFGNGSLDNDKQLYEALDETTA